MTGIDRQQLLLALDRDEAWTSLLSNHAAVRVQEALRDLNGELLDEATRALATMAPIVFAWWAPDSRRVRARVDRRLVQAARALEAERRAVACTLPAADTAAPDQEHLHAQRTAQRVMVERMAAGGAGMLAITAATGAPMVRVERWTQGAVAREVPSRRGAPRRRDPVKQARVLELAASGVSLPEIRDEVRLPYQVVRQWVIDAGIEYTRIPAGQRPARAMPEQVRLRALQLLQEGMTIPEVRAAMELPYQTIYQWANAAGIEYAKAQRGRPRTAAAR